MSVIARQSTAFETAIGPVLDADGVAVTDCVVGDFKIKKTSGNFAALNGSATLTHVSAGFYDLVLTTSDLDTVGVNVIAIDDTTNGCGPLYIQVVEEAVFDMFYAASATGKVTLGDTAHGGSAAALILKGITVTATDTDASAVTLTGNGSGEGLLVVGGDSGGNGLEAMSGAAGGVGIYAHSAMQGQGIAVIGAGSAEGLMIQGGESGTGLAAYGGATNGIGALIESQGNGIGLHIMSTGSGAAMAVDGQGAGADLDADIAGNLSGSIGSLASQAKADVNAEATTAFNAVAVTGSVNDSSATTTSFISDSGLSSADDFYNGCALVPTSGALKGIARKVTDYVGATRTFTFGVAFPSAPANGVTFSILGRIE